MAQKTENIRICDICKVKVSDDGEIHYGGNPHQEWFTICQTGGSTQLRELKKKKEWDICSLKCLKKFVDSLGK